MGRNVSVFNGPAKVYFFHNFNDQKKCKKRIQDEQLPVSIQYSKITNFFTVSISSGLLAAIRSVRDDPIKIIMINVPGDLFVAFQLNYPKIPDSWFLIQFCL